MLSSRIRSFSRRLPKIKSGQRNPLPHTHTKQGQSHRAEDDIQEFPRHAMIQARALRGGWRAAADACGADSQTSTSSQKLTLPRGAQALAVSRCSHSKQTFVTVQAQRGAGAKRVLILGSLSRFSHELATAVWSMGQSIMHSQHAAARLTKLLANVSRESL